MKIKTTNILITLVASVMVVILLMDVTSAQITFSKDWRPGGKRSLDNNYGCQQLADMAVIKIRDLIRRESLNILHCESGNTQMTSPNDSIK